MAKTIYQPGIDFSSPIFQNYAPLEKKAKRINIDSQAEALLDMGSKPYGKRPVIAGKERNLLIPRIQFILRHVETGVCRMNFTTHVNSSVGELFELNRLAVRINIDAERKKKGKNTSPLLAIRAATQRDLIEYFDVGAGVRHCWEIVDVRHEPLPNPDINQRKFNHVFLIRHLLEIDPGKVDLYSTTKWPGIVVDPGAPRGYVTLPQLKDTLGVPLENRDH